MDGLHTAIYDIRAPTQEVDLGDVLRVISDELLSLGRTAEQLQNTISPVIMRSGVDAACRREMQACDQLTQLLYGVSAFVAALKPSMHPSWKVDTSAAGSVVLLSALAQRLCCLDTPAPEFDSGDIEMF